MTIDAKKDLPPYLWEAAHKQASRSSLKTFKTGAIIFKDDFKIVSKGCSHHTLFRGKPSIHAEANALDSFRGTGSALGLNVLIYTLGRSNRPAFSSRPCYSCLHKMDKVGIKNIYYLEKLNSGWFVLNIETPLELKIRAMKAEVRESSYARNMRIP